MSGVRAAAGLLHARVHTCVRTFASQNARGFRTQLQVRTFHTDRHTSKYTNSTPKYIKYDEPLSYRVAIVRMLESAPAGGVDGGILGTGGEKNVLRVAGVGRAPFDELEPGDAVALTLLQRFIG